MEGHPQFVLQCQVGERKVLCFAAGLMLLEQENARDCQFSVHRYEVVCNGLREHTEPKSRNMMTEQLEIRSP